MRRIVDLSFASTWLRLLALWTSIVYLNGCAMKNVHEQSRLIPSHLEETIKRNEFSVEKRNDIIGRLAVIRLEKGDTLPDIARHFSLGIDAISAANSGVDVWLPEAGERIVLPLSFILPDAPRKGIVVNLATMRLFQFKGNGTSQVVSTYPVGVGTNERLPGRPVNTPVVIVNQPYLIGQRNGILYLEAHTPQEDSGAIELEKVYAKLRAIEKKSGRTLDWKRVEKIQAEARGIPVPIFAMSQRGEQEAAKTMEPEHLDKLYGMPEIAKLKDQPPALPLPSLGLN